jgi:hypothetical protein
MKNASRRAHLDPILMPTLMRSRCGLEVALSSSEVPKAHRSMLDLFYIALIAILFAFSIAMIRFFDRL